MLLYCKQFLWTYVKVSNLDATDADFSIKFKRSLFHQIGTPHRRSQHQWFLKIVLKHFRFGFSINKTSELSISLENWYNKILLSIFGSSIFSSFKILFIIILIPSNFNYVARVFTRNLFSILFRSFTLSTATLLVRRYLVDLLVIIILLLVFMFSFIINYLFWYIHVIPSLFWRSYTLYIRLPVFPLTSLRVERHPAQFSSKTEKAHSNSNLFKTRFTDHPPKSSHHMYERKKYRHRFNSANCIRKDRRLRIATGFRVGVDAAGVGPKWEDHGEVVHQLPGTGNR